MEENAEYLCVCKLLHLACRTQIYLCESAVLAGNSMIAPQLPHKMASPLPRA